MNLPAFALKIITATAGVKYPLLFVGSVIEGPILFFASGILLKMGAVSLFPLFIALMAGDLTGDIIWYYIGRNFAEPMMKKNGKFIGMSPENFEKTKEVFTKSHGQILFTSKATLGYGTSIGTLFILMTAGITRVPLGKYLKLNALGEVILLSIFITSGYLFGKILGTVEKDLRISATIVSAIIVLTLGYGFSRYWKNRHKEQMQ